MSTATDPAPDTAGGPAVDADRRERVGWYLYDWAASAFNTTVITVFLGPYLGSVARTAAGCGGEGADCSGRYLYPLGVEVSPGSFFAYAVSLSVLLTVLVVPVVGAIADRSGRKKRMLAGFAYLGAGATVAMGLVTDDRYLLGGVLLVVANIAFTAAFTVYNSFLPALAGPDQRDAVSSTGWAIGYLGGGLLLLGNVVAVFVGDAAGWSTGAVARGCLVSAGVWWAVFTVIPLRRLRDRPPAPELTAAAGSTVLTAGFVQLGRTLRELVGRYPITLAFLGAFLIYNDGIQTVISLAGVYGTEALGFDDTELVPTILMVQFLAFVGALALGRLAQRIGAWKTILLSLVLWTAVLVVAYLLPAQRLALFVALGAAIGLVLGGSQALSRSLFSQLVPAGKEAEYYSLYEISDKGTSWLGPLVFGLAYQWTGDYRISIASLVVFFVVGFVALLAVPVRRGILAAGNAPPRML